MQRMLCLPSKSVKMTLLDGRRLHHLLHFSKRKVGLVEGPKCSEVEHFQRMDDSAFSQIGNLCQFGTVAPRPPTACSAATRKGAASCVPPGTPTDAFHFCQFGRFQPSTFGMLPSNPKNRCSILRAHGSKVATFQHLGLSPHLRHAPQ